MAQVIPLTGGQVAPPGPGGPAAPDLAAAAVAARQCGVVTYEQLLACGMTSRQIDRRVAAGQLQRLWRGVYAFGHRELRPGGYLIAAVLACGPGAFLGYRSGSTHWGLLAPAQGPIDVVVAGRSGRARRRGIRIHTARRLDPQDVTSHRGIPITTPAKTLVDLSAVVSARLTERAVEQAHVLRLLPPGALEDALERSNGRKTRALRRLIDIDRRIATITRSELEEIFLALIRRAGLPDPEVNQRVAGYEVDFLWRTQRLVVEVDGFAYHSTRQAATRDRRKDDDLQAAGYRVIRFTADQILHDPEDALARLRRALTPPQ